MFMESIIYFFKFGLSKLKEYLTPGNSEFLP